LRGGRVWRSVLGVEHTVIEKRELETLKGEDVLVASVRPHGSLRALRAAGDDAGAGPRRWRGVDAGTTRLYPQAPGSWGAVCRAWGDCCRSGVGAGSAVAAHWARTNGKS